MNKILFTIFLFPVLLFAQDTCQITGTVYLVDGKTPFANGRIFVTRADKSGSLFLNTSKTYRTNASGVVTFSAPRTTGTDTAYVTVRSDFGNLTTEEILAVPDAATANLATLAGVNRYSTSTVLVPYGQFYVGRGNDTARVMYTLALAGGIGMQIDAYGRPQLFLNSDSLATGSGVTVGVLSDSLDANPRGGGGGISASELSDSLDADPRYRIDITARNITAGKADADSVSQQITLVKNMLDTKGDSDSLAWVADTAKAGNLAANTARAVADAHALRTDNPHTVTAAQLGALTSESDPTAAAKAQTVVSDTIDVIVPRTGIVVTSRLADSLAARALAVGDSLLAMRGFVRSAIKDTLVKYSYGIMAGDTAALAAVLDALYARSGGGAAVDTSLLVGNNRDDLSIQGDKWFKGHVMLTKQLWMYDSTRAKYINVLRYDNDVLGIGANVTNYTYFYSNAYKVSAFSAGGLETQNNTYIWAKGDSRIAIGTTTKPTTSNMKPLYVVGGAQITDTTRFGDWTTYSYIIPGGDLVKSSTRDIKIDISAIETPKDFEARILSVSPKRYRFKPEAYMRGVSDTLKGEDLTKALAEDAAQAAKQSERVVTGFIAEEFNPAFGIDPASKEIHTSDIIAAQWKAIQMLTARVKALEARLAKLEGAR